MFGKSPHGALYFTSPVLAEDCKMFACGFEILKKNPKDQNISDSPPSTKKCPRILEI